MKTSPAKAIVRPRGKKYRAVAPLVDRTKTYQFDEATALLCKVNTATFDASAEAHIRINADTTQADQLVRTTVNLPHGTGKVVRVAAFVTSEKEAEAKKAGADVIGGEDLIKLIEAGEINFDTAVAVPAMMKSLGKIAKTLGQKGLMPSPKAGTVTEQIGKAITELKKGRIECKMDKAGIIHVPFGKVSFGPAKLKENLEALMSAITEARPVGIKNTYILSVTIAPSMGPGVKVQI